MKTKAFLFLFVFTFVAQIIQAQKTGLLLHIITINLPQFVDLSLSLNSNPSIIDKRKSHAVTIKNTNLWLNYHSILKGEHLEPSKNIKAQLTSNKLNENFSLSLIALKDIGKGTGDIGKTFNKSILLNNCNAVKIIDDIGIAYTGNNTFEGHNIIYHLHSNNKTILNQSKNLSKNLSVTFTLFDN